MTPADDFSDDYGWDDESLQRRERRRKEKNRERQGRLNEEKEMDRPRKGFERRQRRNRDWDDKFFDED